MSNDVTKCIYCEQYYFKTDSTKCPYCGKEQTKFDFLELFNDIFKTTE